MKVRTGDSSKLSDFKLLFFDYFGTLVDWESGIYEHLKPLLARLPPSHPFKNNKDLAIKAYNDIEFSIRCDYSNPTYSYAARLSKAYLNLASSLSLPPPPQSEADALSASIPKWPAFPDTVAALHRLKKHYRIVVLFNVGYEIFKHLLDDALGGVEFDALFVNEDIVGNRPDLYNLNRPLQDIQMGEWALLRQVLYTAHVIELDDESEEEMPLGIVWIDRGKTTGNENTMEKVGDEVAYTWRFEDLKGMADAVDEEFGQAGKIVSEVDRGIER